MKLFALVLWSFLSASAYADPVIDALKAEFMTAKLGPVNDLLFDTEYSCEHFALHLDVNLSNPAIERTVRTTLTVAKDDFLDTIFHVTMSDRLSDGFMTHALTKGELASGRAYTGGGYSWAHTFIIRMTAKQKLIYEMSTRFLTGTPQQISGIASGSPIGGTSVYAYGVCGK